MGETIAGRTASAMPGLDIAEQRAWQNFLDATLRMYGTLNRALVDEHQLTLNDVRLLDILDRSPTGSARMGDLADELMSPPSRLTRQIHRLEAQLLVGRCSSRVDRRGVPATITDRGVGGELPADRDGAEVGRDARTGGTGLDEALRLSTVAWQSGLMHSP